MHGGLRTLMRSAVWCKLIDVANLCINCGNLTVGDRTLCFECQGAPHGELATYSAGCRCDLCRSANAAYMRDIRKGIRKTRKRWRQVSDHGTESRYQGGCKCDDCHSASRAAQFERQIRNRHGMELFEYALLVDIQNLGCAICVATFTGRVCIDHAHHCPHPDGQSCEKCWRGLLCDECNKQLERKVGHAFIRQEEGCATDDDLRVLEYIRHPPANLLRSHRQNRTDE